MTDAPQVFRFAVKISTIWSGQLQEPSDAHALLSEALTLGLAKLGHVRGQTIEVEVQGLRLRAASHEPKTKP